MRVDMGVQKFRSIEEMNKAPLPERPGSDFERSYDTVPAGGPLCPNSIQGGVFKFRTLEEAQKAREKHLPLK